MNHPNNNPSLHVYNQRWQFFYDLSGIAMSIYNTLHYGLGAHIYALYYIYLVQQAQHTVTQHAQLPLYWGDAPIGANIDIHLLVDSGILTDIYQIDEVTQPQRDYLKNRMSITHCPYGMIINFSRDILYSEWYALDPQSGVIDKINMLH